MLTVVLLLLIVVLPLLIVLYLLLIAFTLLLTVSGSLVQVQSCPDTYALSAILDWPGHHYDIHSAYLHGDVLQELIFMRQPPGFTIKGQEDLVLKLIKPLYGLK